MDLFQRHAADSLLPKGDGLLWRADLVSLNVAADALMALAYIVMTCVLIRFARRHRDLRSHRIFRLVVGFVLLTGASHLVEIWTIWTPSDVLQNLLKVAAGFASLAAVALMWPRLPQLASLMRALQTTRTESGLAATAHELECCAAARTRELDRINSELKRQIAEREASEAEVARLNRDLRRRVDELQTILDLAPVGIAVAKDPHCDLIVSNRACAEMLGIPQGRNISKSGKNGDKLPFRIYTKDGVELAPEDLPTQRAARLGMEISGLELHIVHHDGRVLNLYEYAVPLYDENNQIRGCLGIFVDITSRMDIERELQAAKEAAVAASRAKTAFLANMSHEIRTPLGAVLGFSELLLHADPTEEERAYYIEAIERNGRLLTVIIDDILDLSKVEAGKMVFHRQQVVVADVVADLHAAFSPEARAKGVTLNIQVAEAMPEHIETDASRLRQILLNVIGNAVKFTERGRIDVDIRAMVTAAGRYRLCIRVSDTGIGIRPEHADGLFEPFNQIDSSATRRFGGTGLGLALSRKLAEGLGGNVWLESSEPGKGSTFVITLDAGDAGDTREVGNAEGENDVLKTEEVDLVEAVHPLAEADDGQATDESVEPASGFITGSTPMTLSPMSTMLASGPESVLRGQRILIVEDVEDNRLLITRMLTMAGVEVCIACNGREAVRKASEEDCDAILMDVQMPVMDGFEAIAVLRRQGYARPIIALTAHALKEERARCLAKGFDGHISKPIDRATLLNVLCQVIQAGGKRHCSPL